MQLIQLERAESSDRKYTMYSSIMYGDDFLPIPTGSAVCICHNILVFHFMSSSTFINGLTHLPTEHHRPKVRGNQISFWRG